MIEQKDIEDPIAAIDLSENRGWGMSSENMLNLIQDLKMRAVTETIESGSVSEETEQEIIAFLVFNRMSILDMLDDALYAWIHKDGQLK